MKPNIFRKLLFLLCLVGGCLSTETVPTLLTSPESSKSADSQTRGMPGFRSDIPSFPQNVSYRTIAGFPEYVIGSEDLIKISLWNKNVADTHVMRVRPNGKISFLFLDYLTVAGLTSTEVDALITEKLKRFYRKPRVDVTVEEHKHHNIFLLGEVEKISGVPQSGAGKYSLKGRTTLLELVLNAGGPSDSANLSQVALFRNGISYPVNLYNIMFQGEQQAQIILENNDRILIPPMVNKNRPEKTVYILGEVKHPGMLTFKGNLSLLKSITRAGGYSKNAVTTNIRIIRGDIKKPEVITCDMNKFLNSGDLSQNIQIQDGDVIYVPQTNIASVGKFLSQFQPIFQALLYPGMIRDLYTTGGGLRMNTGSSEPSSTTTILQTQ